MSKKIFIRSSSAVKENTFQIGFCSNLPDDKGVLNVDRLVQENLPQDISTKDMNLFTLARSIIEELQYEDVACILLIFDAKNYIEYKKRYECSPVFFLISLLEGMIPHAFVQLIDDSDTKNTFQ